MRKANLLALIAFFISVSSSASAEPSFRTHFEVSLLDANGDHTVSSGVAVQSGEPFVYDLNSYEFRFVPVFDSSGGYVLTFTVAEAPKAKGTLPIPSSHRFEGKVGVPLDFTVNSRYFHLSGAIVFSKVGE